MSSLRLLSKFTPSTQGLSKLYAGDIRLCEQEGLDDLQVITPRHSQNPHCCPGQTSPLQ